MKYSVGKWHLRKTWRGTITSPAMIEVRGRDAALGVVYLTDPDTKRRTPEFAGNAALMLGAAEMYRMLNRASRLTGSPLLKREIDRLLAKIEKQAEEICPRKN